MNTQTFKVTIRGTSYRPGFGDRKEGEFTRLAKCTVLATDEKTAEQTVMTHLLSPDVDREIGKMVGEEICWEWRVESINPLTRTYTIISIDLGSPTPSA